MAHNAFAHIKYYRQLIRQMTQYLHDHRTDLVIVCDSPAFNFHIAKAAKANGIKVLFYVAPQLWAWAPWRIGKMRRLCDKLACILPFEEKWFGNKGIDASFVGNPLFDGLAINVVENCKDYTSFDQSKATIALLPGSRDAEIKTLWPSMQKIALKLKSRWPTIKFIASAYNTDKLELLKSREIKNFKCKYTISDVPSLAKKVDLALVASGSATLQVASSGCPMIVMYRTSRILWHLVGRWLIRTRFLSLVNILAGRQLVPEFMPHFGSITPIVDRCKMIMRNKSRLAKISRELVRIVAPMAEKNASENTAKIVLEMID
jgi:lipid-A-disaccharide synthase